MALTDSQIKHYRQLAKQQLGLSHINDRRLSAEQKRLIESKVKALSGQEIDNEQMAAMNARDRANSTVENMWGDFGTGGLGESIESPGFDGISQPTRQRDQVNEPEEEEDEESNQQDSDDSNIGNNNKDSNVDDSNPNQEENGGESKINEPKPDAGKTPNPNTGEAAEKAASKLGKSALEGTGTTAGASGAASGAAAGAGAAEGAVVAAETGAVAVEFLPWIIGIIVVIVIVVLLAGIKLPIGGPEDKNAGAGVQSTICLDPGHPSEVGSGTTGPSGTTEKEMVLKVANELKPKLETAGYKVVLTRTDNTTLVTNTERAQICSDAGAAIMYRIHLNNSGGIKGPFHWYPPTKYSNISTTSKGYADTIHNQVVSTLGIKGNTKGAEPIDGGVHPDGKTLVGTEAANKLSLPSVLVEMMTMDTNGEKWITNNNNRAKMVEGMFKGISGAIPPTTGVSSATGVVGKAQSQLGKPYVYGTASGADCNNWKEPSKESGCANYDCSSFVGWAWYWGTNKKVMLERTTNGAWANRNSSKYTVFYDEKQLQPGDLIYWSDTRIHHVGIYLSKDTYIHAPKTGDVVKISKISARGEKAAGYLRPKQ